MDRDEGTETHAGAYVPDADDVFGNVFAAELARLLAAAPAPPDTSGSDVDGAAGGYESPPLRHRHQCGRCGTVWEHDNEFAAGAEAHTCPGCHHCADNRRHGGDVHRWPMYEGPLPPTDLSAGT